MGKRLEASSSNLECPPKGPIILNYTPVPILTACISVYFAHKERRLELAFAMKVDGFIVCSQIPSLLHCAWSAPNTLNYFRKHTLCVERGQAFIYSLHLTAAPHYLYSREDGDSMKQG